MLYPFVLTGRSSVILLSECGKMGNKELALEIIQVMSVSALLTSLPLKISSSDVLFKLYQAFSSPAF